MDPNTSVIKALHCKYTVKYVLSSHSKKDQKLVFKTKYLLMQSEVLQNAQEIILQYFRTTLSYLLSFRPLLCLFLSGHLRQILLYLKYLPPKIDFMQFAMTVCCSMEQ